MTSVDDPPPDSQASVDSAAKTDQGRFTIKYNSKNKDVADKVSDIFDKVPILQENQGANINVTVRGKGRTSRLLSPTNSE